MRAIAARATIAASPKFAGSLSVVFEGLRQRREHQAREMAERVAAETGVEALAARLLDSQECEDLLLLAVELAARTSSAAKRRLLGRVVTQAVLDDAKVDTGFVILRVLDQIDAPHARAVEDILRAEEAADAAGELEPVAVGAERPILPRITDVTKRHPAPVLSQLAALGVVETAGALGGSTLFIGLTEFGILLGRDLRQAGREDSEARPGASVTTE